MIRVFIVEDEMMIRKGIILGTDWAAIDCTVVGEASNGADALVAIEETKPDLIITDLKMPRMDGLEMISRLREKNNNAAVIILTAFNTFSYAQTALRLGVVDFLLKPFHDGELEDAVKRISGRFSKETGNLSTEDLPDFLPRKEGVSRYVLEAMDTMEAHCGDPDFSISVLAEQMSLSESHLSHLFKKETGHSVNGYLTRYRMYRAMQLLKDPHKKIYEVAEALGYRDIAYFSTTFKKIVGKTPSEYQSEA